MSDMILMICKYCGGKLVCIQDNLWLCENCGTKTLIEINNGKEASTERRVLNGFSMSVEHGGQISNYRVREIAEFEIAFNRRATMADPLPMNVDVKIDGRSRRVFEHLPKSGKGSVIFEVEGNDVTAYSTGSASFSDNIGNTVHDGAAEGYYSIAGLKIGIHKNGDEEE